MRGSQLIGLNLVKRQRGQWALDMSEAVCFKLFEDVLVAVNMVGLGIIMPPTDERQNDAPEERRKGSQYPNSQ
jgi:hypothetical protein